MLLFPLLPRLPHPQLLPKRRSNRFLCRQKKPAHGLAFFMAN
jgi:hypothetical protein